MMTDNQLLAHVHDNAEEALATLYEKYFDRVLQYAYRRSFDQQIAYDITANTFVKVAENIREFKPKHENAFVGWLFRIASNEVVAYYRKPEKYSSNLGLDEDLVHDDYESDQQSDAELLDTIALYKQLYVSMRKLKPKEQTVIDLYYFERMSYKEIAHSTGMKESAIGVTLHRAVKKLHNELTPIVGGVMTQ